MDHAKRVLELKIKTKKRWKTKSVVEQIEEGKNIQDINKKH